LDGTASETTMSSDGHDVGLPPLPPLPAPPPGVKWLDVPTSDKTLVRLVGSMHQRLGRPVTVAGAVAEAKARGLGLTAAAVREGLARLAQAGCLGRGRGGRGYKPRGLTLF
jgi:hypothetical protein